MFRVFTCLTVDHDWRLVVLAGTVCFLASAVAINLFHRAQATKGRARLVWLSLDAAAAGFGIWATSSRSSPMPPGSAQVTISV
jgi:NO-binding membrane sensor protein with MHYT domain